MSKPNGQALKIKASNFFLFLFAVLQSWLACFPAVLEPHAAFG